MIGAVSDKDLNSVSQQTLELKSPPMNDQDQVFWLSYVESLWIIQVAKKK